MISYFYHRKGNITTCEDSFTSLLFDLLKYLPIDISWGILKNSLFQDKLPKVSGEILDIQFWHKLSADNTSNTRYIEPDIFIKFNDFDIIIEAKKNNEKGQYSNQIENEIRAYLNEFENEKKTLFFIQLGGLENQDNLDDENRNNIIVKHCKTNWSRVLEQIVFERNKIEAINNCNVSSWKRILDDLIKGFELHGHFKTFWLKDLKHIVINSNETNWFEYARKK